MHVATTEKEIFINVKIFKSTDNRAVNRRTLTDT